MHEERLAEFSHEHLDGQRPAGGAMGGPHRYLLDLTSLEPGPTHPAADPGMQAINAGTAEMSRWANFIAEGWIGYRMHPDEPADRQPPALELDTEFTYRSLAGCNPAELGLPLSTRDYDALHDPGYVVDPEKLIQELIDAEREKLR
jgi:hypothetical protein